MIPAHGAAPRTPYRPAARPGQRSWLALRPHPALAHILSPQPGCQRETLGRRHLPAPKSTRGRCFQTSWRESLSVPSAAWSANRENTVSPARSVAARRASRTSRTCLVLRIGALQRRPRGSPGPRSGLFPDRGRGCRACSTRGSARAAGRTCCSARAVPCHVRGFWCGSGRRGGGSPGSSSGGRRQRSTSEDRCPTGSPGTGRAIAGGAQRRNTHIVREAQPYTAMNSHKQAHQRRVRERESVVPHAGAA